MPPNRGRRKFRRQQQLESENRRRRQLVARVPWLQQDLCGRRLRCLGRLQNHNHLLVLQQRGELCRTLIPPKCCDCVTDQ